MTTRPDSHILLLTTLIARATAIQSSPTAAHCVARALVQRRQDSPCWWIAMERLKSLILDPALFHTHPRWFQTCHRAALLATGETLATNREPEAPFRYAANAFHHRSTLPGWSHAHAPLYARAGFIFYRLPLIPPTRITQTPSLVPTNRPLRTS